MSPFGRVLKAAAAVMVLVTAAVMVLEILELSHGGSGRGWSGGGGGGARHADGTGREDIMINPATLLPNEWRVKTEGGGGCSLFAVRVQLVGVCYAVVPKRLDAVGTSERRGESVVKLKFSTFRLLL